MTLLYPDLSHYSWDRHGGQPDWAALRASGVQVVCIRATYGDPQVFAPATRHFREMATAAKAAGLYVGGYHNLIRGDDASIGRQVDWFRAELDAVDADWAMLDVEPYEALKANGLWPRLEDARRFEDRWDALEARRRLVHYLARWFWARPVADIGLGSPDLTALRGPLVASNYPAGSAEDPAARYAAVGGDSGPGWAPYGGKTPAVWQFGSTLTWPGVSDTEDANAYRGTIDDFVRLTRREAPVGWYLNRALTNFRTAVNARYPLRDMASDGTIGDPAHLARTSDHNPDPSGESDAGSVDAWDMDVELNGASEPYAEDVEQLKRVFEAHESSKYWIHDDMISFRSEGWKPRSYAYAGENRNRHTRHVHFNTRESHEASTAPWIIEEEADMTPEEHSWLQTVHRNLTVLDGRNPIGQVYTRQAMGEDHTDPAFKVQHPSLKSLGAQITALTGAVAALAGKDLVDEQTVVDGVLAGLGAKPVADVVTALVAAGIDPVQLRDEAAKRVATQS